MSGNITIHFRSLLFTCLCLFLLPGKVRAQSTYNRVNIASPNAASLGKFVDIPVNYHTGIPKVDIPIYTVSDGKLQLPISLSYHAGGIKVAESASWVGAGWALNAGGVITRTVRGIPDEAANTAAGRNGWFNNYGFSSYLVDAGNPDVLNTADVRNLSSDGEPDLFFFNFNGHSGKFYFNDDRAPVLVSADEDLKIDYFYRMPVAASTFLNTNIQGFCITTGDGTKYFFGKTKAADPVQGVYPVEISVPFSLGNGLSSDRVVSSWYLNRIESADQSSAIDLFYEAESFSDYSWSYFPVPLTSGTEEDSKGYQLLKMYTNGIRLSKISFSTGSVTFNPLETPRLDLSNGISSPVFNDGVNTSAKALKEIVISNTTSMIKKFSFYTGYFQDNTSGLPAGASSAGTIISDTKRLRLDSILESDATGNSLKPYKFDYYSNFLPRRLSFSLDHWGFYNGAANSSIMPTFTINTYDVYAGANRDAAWPAMENGGLTKITYPTGGSTDFEFEPNKAKVDATAHNLVYDRQYWVGFDGAYTIQWPNLTFTGNEKYQLVLSNTGCGPSTITNCDASYTIFRADGSALTSGSASSSSSETVQVTIPAGVYTISMSRGNVYSGTGATLTFSKYVTVAITDPIVGGLRIKKITKNPLSQESPAMVENYTYEENGRSTGVLFERPHYVYQLRSDLVALIGINNFNGVYSTVPYGCVPSSVWNGGFFENRIKSPCSILPMSNTQGNHIGYSAVRVDLGPGGYSIYRFITNSSYQNFVNDVAYRDLSTNCDLTSPSFPAAPLRFEFNRGDLSTEDHFDSNGSLRKEVFYTSAYDSTKVYTPAIKADNMNGFVSQVEYQLRGYWKKYSTRYETLIDKQTSQEQHTIDSTFYTSRFHRSPTKKTAILSNGKLSINNIKYALDFPVPSAEAIADGWDTYLSGCASCLVTYNTKLNNSSLSTTDRATAYHAYRACVSKARKAYITYRRVNFTDAGNSYSTAHLNAKNTADTEFKPVLEMQDQFINAEVESTSWADNKLTKSAYSTFSFEPGTSNVYQGELKVINLTAPLSSDFTNSTNSNTAISKDARYESIFLYRYSSGNIIEQSKVSGPKEVFVWGYNHKYPVARVLGADYNTVIAVLDQNVLNNVNTTDDQMRTELNKLRVSFPGVQASTYTYAPLSGITSQTDPKGLVTYYEYDQFQRLMNIKDQSGNIIKNYLYHYKN